MFTNEKLYKHSKEERKGEFTMKEQKSKKNNGITIIALVITILFPYDEKLKYSNSKGFLLTTI